MLLLVLIALPLAELAAFVAVGLAIGWLPAVGLLFGVSLLGFFVLGAESRAAFARVSLAASERRSPGPAAVDASLGLLGALLLVVPGFVTDVLGLPLLFPPTQRLVRRLLSRHLARRVTIFAARAGRFGPGPPGGRPADVEGTVVEDEPQQLER
jgi:UPF0716 protein FxsA